MEAIIMDYLAVAWQVYRLRRSFMYRVYNGMHRGIYRAAHVRRYGGSMLISLQRGGAGPRWLIDWHPKPSSLAPYHPALSLD